MAERWWEIALGSFGRPPDAVANGAIVVALVLATLAALGRGRSLLGLGPEPLARRPFLFGAAFAAALLSLLYVAVYLRGGPRIIDATTYFLQGRALSEGSFSWEVLEPSASFRGRFLLFRAEQGTMGGIFPPGYPLLLALGFGLGAPMVVGPVLAGALVVATYRLSRALASEAGLGADVEPVARAAALLSVTCAALRYHTADTMAHGAAALGVAIAVERAVRTRLGPERTTSAVFTCGLALGYVAATRPVSALAPAFVVILLVREPRRVAWLCAGVLPGLLLLAIAQHAVTGEWWASSQRAYYALADGPPDCFRWGFGAGTGCVHEHGEFVAARMPSGYGAVEALGTTLRRFKMHALDVANFEPLALLSLAPLLRTRTRSIACVTALVPLQALAYAPFYFDGNYPGGGARLFADILPAEHALMAMATALFVRSPRVPSAVHGLLALSLVGFGVHGIFDHRRLAARDGGRPMFEPDVVTRSGVREGLVFVDTDHGFALGHDPEARPGRGVVVGRLRNDAHDWVLYDALERPPSYLYRFVMGLDGVATPELSPWTPPDPGAALRFDAEADWPVLAQAGGFAVPAWTHDCASGSQVLALTPSEADAPATATLSIPVREAGRYSLKPRITHGVRVPFARSFPSAKPPEGVLAVEGLPEARWRWTEIPGGDCQDLFERDVDLVPPVVRLRLEARNGPVALDAVTLQKLP